MDIYKVMSNRTSTNSTHHTRDRMKTICNKLKEDMKKSNANISTRARGSE